MTLTPPDPEACQPTSPTEIPADHPAVASSSEPAAPPKDPRCATSRSLLPEVRTVSYEQLSGGAREVVIEFAGQFYRLRTTRNGKLILNK